MLFCKREFQSATDCKPNLQTLKKTYVELNMQLIKCLNQNFYTFVHVIIKKCLKVKH